MLPPALALTLLLLGAPLAAAQAPPPPEPDALVAVVCGADPTLRDALPLCPREEPAAPQPAEEAPDAADAPAPEPADAPPAHALADEAADAAGDIVDNPGSAPGSLAGLAATVLQFVRDLLEIPLVGARASLDAVATLLGAAGAAAHAVGDAAAAAGRAGLDAAAVVGETVQAGLALVADLLAPATRDAPAPVAVPAAPDAARALDADALELLDVARDAAA